MDRDPVFSLTLFIIFDILIYLCDFPKRCQLSFRLNTGTSVAGKKTTGLSVGGYLVLCENQGGREGRLVTLIRVLCQKAVQSQIIFPVLRLQKQIYPCLES